MCGFAGFVDSTREMGAEFLGVTAARMADALRHRGPDDSGVWVDAAAGVALGFRRLSIVDLSPEGHQPMASASGRYVILFNGEIYNFAALRRELAGVESPPAYRGHSDTEVLLAAVEQWGVEAAVRRFVGMYAFALWDRKERRLTLGRDRLGEKPLYYGWMGRTFLFGSELKALRAHPDFRGEVDRDALVPYLRSGYIPAPYSVYKGVYKLPPGALLTLDHASPGQLPAPVPYWSAREVVEAGLAEPFTGGESEAIDRLDGLLREAVRLQMVSDVPLGAFLSGGVDSSAVVALMQAQSPCPVKTFTIGFDDAEYNEADHAKAVARHLGTDHTELYVTPADTLGVIPRLPTLYDEPFADSSQIPTFLVARLASRSVTVRFLDRFNVLSKVTYPEYRGTDINGCKEVLKVIVKSMPSIKDEVQFGKNKLFVRKPETYFAIEKLREARMDGFVISIQSAWRRFSGRKVLVSLTNIVNELYLKENKTRRRDSIYRPFCQDYLASIGSAEYVDTVRDAIYRIIDHYDNKETIVFIDASAHQIIGTPTVAPFHVIESRIVVLTTAAVYICELWDTMKWQNELRKQNLANSPKKLPSVVFLKRRIVLKDTPGGLDSVHLSRCADSLIVLQVKASPAPVGKVVPNQDNWLTNDKVMQCPITGEHFSLFNRRHHCRVSGNITVDSVNDFKQTLPDFRYGKEAQRVSDPYIGLASTDVLEDVVLVLTRKTEFAALVSIEVQKANGRAPDIASSGSSKKGAATVDTSTLRGIKFDNRIPLRRCAPLEGVSVLPNAVEMVFVESSTTNNPVVKNAKVKGTAQTVTHDFTVTVQDNKVMIASPAGLSTNVVRERRERQAERQKKAEKRRRREDKERQERRAEREEQREGERLQRLAEKKAKKAAEKEGKRLAEEQAAAAPVAQKSGARRFGNNSPVNADSESSSRETTPTARGGAAGGLRSNNNSSGNLNGGAAPSSAANELAAAMARRRAKADA